MEKIIAEDLLAGISAESTWDLHFEDDLIPSELLERMCHQLATMIPSPPIHIQLDELAGQNRSPELECVSPWYVKKIPGGLEFGHRSFGSGRRAKTAEARVTLRTKETIGLAVLSCDPRGFSDKNSIFACALSGSRRPLILHNMPSNDVKRKQ